MENKSSKNKILNSTNGNEISVTNNRINPKQKKHKEEIIKAKIQEKQIKEIKSEENKNEDEDDFILPARTIKRSNSIKLYKRHQKEKQRRESSIKEPINNVKKDDLVKENPDRNGTNRTSKTKKKKVNFLPDFITIIDVESYKKFNEENTCKDPFDDPNFLNGGINLNFNDDDDEMDGKARLQCSCSMF